MELFRFVLKNKIIGQNDFFFRIERYILRFTCPFVIDVIEQNDNLFFPKTVLVMFNTKISDVTVTSMLHKEY